MRYICSKCGASLDDNAQFCNNCGSKIDDIYDLGGVRCPNCGRLLSEEAAFCPFCGKSTEKTESENKNKSAIIAVAVFSIVFLLIIIGIFVNKSKNKPEPVPERTIQYVVITPTPEPTAEPTEKPTKSPTEEPTEKPTKRPTEKSMPYWDRSQYLYPSDRYWVTEDFLDGLDKDTVRLVLNEIYARHGYHFTSSEYRNHFNRTSWYSDLGKTMDECKREFNDYEKGNVDFIVAYEKDRGYR